MAEENNQYTFEHETYRKTYWHTCSHILAQAMKRLHPDVKLAIGRPSTMVSTTILIPPNPFPSPSWRSWRLKCARSARKN